MKNYKFLLSIGLCICTMFVLTGCFGSKSITPKKFIEVAQKYGYKTLEDLEKSGVDKSQIDMAKAKFDANIDKTKISNATMVMNSNLFDMASSGKTPQNMSFDSFNMSIASLMEFKEEKIAEEFMSSLKNSQGLDSEASKEMQKKLGIEMKIEEVDKGKVKRMVMTMKMGELVTTTICSRVGNNMIQIVNMGKQTDSPDKLLDELGF